MHGLGQSHNHLNLPHSPDLNHLGVYVGYNLILLPLPLFSLLYDFSYEIPRQAHLPIDLLALLPKPLCIICFLEEDADLAIQSIFPIRNSLFVFLGFLELEGFLDCGPCILQKQQVLEIWKLSLEILVNR